MPTASLPPIFLSCHDRLQVALWLWSSWATADGGSSTMRVFDLHMAPPMLSPQNNHCSSGLGITGCVAVRCYRDSRFPHITSVVRVAPWSRDEMLLGLRILDPIGAAASPILSSA